MTGKSARSSRSSAVAWNTAAVGAIRGRIVVSCQAGPESPLNAPQHIAALARSAERGGAAGFRVDGPVNVSAVRAVSELPILGINKIIRPGYTLGAPIGPVRASFFRSGVRLTRPAANRIT